MKNHKDPVCGMELEEKDAAGMDEFEGMTYYFDSEDCMKLFGENPEKYTKQAVEATAKGAGSEVR